MQTTTPKLRWGKSNWRGGDGWWKEEALRFHQLRVGESRAPRISGKLGLPASQRDVEVIFDGDYPTRAPKKGWPQWMRSSLKAANTVFVICTPEYKKAFEGEKTKSPRRGARREALIIDSALYRAGDENSKFVPLLPKGGHPDDIPDTLADHWNDNWLDSPLKRLVALARGDQERAASRKAPRNAPCVDCHDGEQDVLTEELLSSEDCGSLVGAISDVCLGAKKTADVARVLTWIRRDRDSVDQLYRDIVSLKRALERPEVWKGRTGKRKAVERAACAVFMSLVIRIAEATPIEGITRSTNRVPAVVSVEVEESILLGVAASVLFGGRLVADWDSSGALPEYAHVYRISPSRNAEMGWQEFLREVYCALFRAEEPVDTTAPAGKPLKATQLARIPVRVEDLRDVQRCTFALVVRDVGDLKKLAQWAAETNVPVLMNTPRSGTGVPRFPITPEMIHAHLQEFKGTLRRLRGRTGDGQK